MSSTDTDQNEAEAAAGDCPEGDEDREWLAHIDVVVEAASDRKAQGLRVLDLSKISDFTDFFVICSGTNERQVQAIADSILGRLRDVGVKPLHVEGFQHGRWVLLDYGGEMVIHVFLDEQRSFYGLEQLWADAPVIVS